MVLLTAVVVLGVLVNRQGRLPGLPRFAGLSLHRCLSLHWLAYTCWPAALAHSIGSNSAMRSGRLLDLTAGCILAVLAAAGWRLVGTLRGVPRVRRVPELLAALDRRSSDG